MGICLSKFWAISLLLLPLIPVSRGAQAPVFTLEPQSQSATVGSNVTFTSATTGATPMYYEWWFNGSALPSIGSSNLTLLNVGLSNGGTYILLASNSHGTAISSNAVLTVGYPPVVLKHPVSQAAVLSWDTAFSVTASGTAPLGFQWRFNGQNISGATNSSLTIASTQPSNVGSYVAVVTNAFGAVASAVATLEVVSPPDFLWARNVTNQMGDYRGYTEALSLATDDSGNLLVAGLYGGWGADFGGIKLTNDSLNAIEATFVCKYDQWGTVLWVRQFATNRAMAYGTRVAAGSRGDVYVSGMFTGSAIFGTNILTAATSAMFVAKYDSEGQARWAKKIDAIDPNDGNGMALAAGPDGSASVLCAYQGVATFGAIALSNSPAFLAKYSSDGNLMWAKPALGGVAMAVGASGSIYLAGPTNLTTGPALLAKYDSAGGGVWARPFPGAFGLAVDQAENIYTAGAGNGSYGDLVITNTGGPRDLFVAKCNSSGEVIWARQAGSHAHQSGVCVDLDAYGNVYLTAVSEDLIPEPYIRFGNTVVSNAVCLMAKYDANGNALWGTRVDARRPARLSVRSPVAVYLAGTFDYSGCSGQFGTFTLVDNGSCYGDLFVARFTGLEATPPQIVDQPQDQAVFGGANALFSVNAASGTPLSYQWLFNQTNLAAGGTNSTLLFPNVQTSAAGAYSVLVSNVYGAVTSAAVGLFVYPASAWTMDSLKLQTGGQLQFSVGGLAGYSYAIEASSNLTTWVRLATNQAPFVFTDWSATNLPQRFYRTVWLP